jgi:cystathionine beta-lyase/cystathionine gamma-synthase
MFLPKGESAAGVSWNNTMFWNVYYVKGAFLNADAAFEVLQGIRTLEVRMLAKCINTQILARLLDAHPGITVHSHALPHNENYALCQHLMFLGLPAPLFTIDFERAGVPRRAFQKFFDNLAPTFDHMISLGQSNTIVSCPALTTHSELPPDELKRAGITPTMIRFAVGDEDPIDLISHLLHTARFTIDPDVPGFSAAFPSPNEIDVLIKQCYLDAHRRYIESKPPMMREL